MVAQTLRIAIIIGGVFLWLLPHKVASRCSIDCKQDCGPTMPEDYYGDAYKKDGQYKMQEQLKPALKAIIKKNHQKLTYECVWKMLEHLDKHSEGSIEEFYTGHSNSEKASKGDSPDWYWNREHIWPEARLPRTVVPRSHNKDMHHIVAARKGINKRRANRQFCDAATTKEIVTTDSPRIKNDPNWINWAWEPRDEVKGRIARMLFYIDVRYSDDEVKLVNGHVTHVEGEKFPPRMGHLKTMWKWHCKYPAKEEEKTRNNEVYKYQGNRNPFVDDALFAQYVWKFTCKDDKTVHEDRYPDPPESPKTDNKEHQHEESDSKSKGEDSNPTNNKRQRSEGKSSDPPNNKRGTSEGKVPEL